MHEERTCVGDPAQRMTAPAQGGGGGGALVNVPIRRTTHCLHVIPANDTRVKGSVIFLAANGDRTRDL